MERLAIIDLDGVCVDSSARFAKAEEAKAAYIRACEEGYGGAFDPRRANDLYWRTAFPPDLVQFDTLMDGVLDALERIEPLYTIYYLTSRPETMRQATREWFWRHDEIDFVDHSHLIMKPLSQQFVKTPVWKSGTIEVLARLLQPDELLVIDDEHAAQLTADLAHLDCLKVMCCTSLAAALRVIGE